MPPPRPNFLPPNHLRRHRQLDPTRQLTSRELWNQVRFHSTQDPNGTSSNQGQYYISLIRAILYEIQPFPLKPAFRRVRVFVLEEDGLKRSCFYFVERAISIVRLIFHCITYLHQSIKNINWKSVQSFAKSKLCRYTALSFIVLYMYGRFLAYMHEWLHAGPVVFILTLLVLLYTIGLGDNTGASSGIPSAYSVFNRGVQRLIGQEDAETLANQFVRAAAGHGFDARGAGRNNAVGLQVGNIWVDDRDQLENNNGVDEQEAVHERRRRRRLERLQQRDNAEDGAAETPENDVNAVEDTNGELDLQTEEELQDDEQNRSTIARKSGKKARRRNLELRREMQRQRQAAAAMGFGAEINENDMNLREMNAVD